MKAHELGSAAITGALIRSNVRPEEVSDVIMGQVGDAIYLLWKL